MIVKEHKNMFVKFVTEYFYIDNIYVHLNQFDKKLCIHQKQVLVNF